MMNKLNAMCIAAYLSVTGFFKDLKKDERGLSGVVVAVMLILVAILAIVLLWDFLEGWINDMWDTIEGESQIA